MAEILKQVGIQDMTAAFAAIMAFIGVCAFLTSLITEALKGIKALDRLPTKLLCYIVALVITPLEDLIWMAYMGQPVEWYMVFASVLASFVAAKVSMNGWDDVTELARRLIRK